MRIQGFRGNCDSQASWGCAPALPNRIREVFLRVSFQKTSRRQLKVFWCSNFTKMLPRCGRAAHVCEANRNCTMKRNKNLRENRKNRNCLQNREVVMRMQGFRGNCDSKGKLGMCPSLAELYAGGFPKTSRQYFIYQPKANHICRTHPFERRYQCHFLKQPCNRCRRSDSCNGQDKKVVLPLP